MKISLTPDETDSVTQIDEPSNGNITTELQHLEMGWAIDDVIDKTRPWLSIESEAKLRAIADWHRAAAQAGQHTG